MAITTWKEGFRELTVDGWTEVENPDGSFTYEVPADVTKDAEIVWSASDRQPHPGMPAGSKITYWPGQKRAKIVKA